MIVIDANVFIRSIMGPRAPSDLPLFEAAKMLFRGMRDGRHLLTTNDAVIAEVVYVLNAPREYRLPRDEIAAQLRALVDYAGFRIAGKAALLEALDVWTATPSLSFVDALTICRARDGGHELATFDAAMARHAHVPIWRPNGS